MPIQGLIMQVTTKLLQFTIRLLTHHVKSILFGTSWSATSRAFSKSERKKNWNWGSYHWFSAKVASNKFSLYINIHCGATNIQTQWRKCDVMEIRRSCVMGFLASIFVWDSMMHRHVSGKLIFYSGIVPTTPRGEVEGSRSVKVKRLLFKALRYVIHVFIILHTTGYICGVRHHPYTYIFH